MAGLPRKVLGGSIDKVQPPEVGETGTIDRLRIIYIKRIQPCLMEDLPGKMMLNKGLLMVGGFKHPCHKCESNWIIKANIGESQEEITPPNIHFGT